MAAVGTQGNHILICESFLIYQHFHPEPLTLHPEPVEGLHPLPLILSLSKEPLHYFRWIIPPAHPNRPLSRPPSWPWTTP